MKGSGSTQERVGGDEADLLAPRLGKRARYALVQDLGIKFCSNLTQCVIDIWSTLCAYDE